MQFLSSSSLACANTIVLFSNRTGLVTMDPGGLFRFQGLGKNFKVVLSKVQIINHPINEFLYEIKSKDQSLPMPETTVNSWVGAYPYPAPTPPVLTNLRGGQSILVPSPGDINTLNVNLRSSYIDFNYPVEMSKTFQMNTPLTLEINGINESAALLKGETYLTNPEDVSGPNFKFILHFVVTQ